MTCRSVRYISNLRIGDVIVSKNLTYRLVVAEDPIVYSSSTHIRTLYLVTLDKGEAHYVANGDIVKWSCDPLDDRSDMSEWTFVIRSAPSCAANDGVESYDETLA